MNDLTLDALQVALRGLAARQRAVANNVANISTPGYIAERVSFEDGLRSAVAAGAPGATVVEHGQSTDPARTDGNNVNLDDETLGLVKTNLQYQTMVEAVNMKFRLLRTAIGEH